MQLDKNPFTQFEDWYQYARTCDEADIDAMTLATATSDGKPSARIVLYKGISRGGFLIFTNYESRKAIEMLANPYAALVIYWPRSYRQIRIEGHIETISPVESQQYFQTRARGSQIASSISEQSREIPNRDYLLKKYAEFEKKHSEKEIACPSVWGGFRIIPTLFEFWQGQQHRLHDRFCYRKQGEGWQIVRLAP